MIVATTGGKKYGINLHDFRARTGRAITTMARRLPARLMVVRT
jgi:hypothetical protein